MKSKRVANDGSQRWPRDARHVPTAGPLLCLFAETFREPELDRADTILAATLWSLLDHGLISFEWRTERVLRDWAIRGLWEPSREVRVLDVIREKEGTRPGLEGEFLAALDATYPRPQKRGRSADHEGGRPTASVVMGRVHGVVCIWFRRPRGDPESHVVRRAKREVADLGYPPRAAEGSGRLSRLLMRMTRPPKPTAEDFQELRAEAERVLSRWRSFLVEEPELWRALVEACRSGIDAMRSTE